MYDLEEPRDFDLLLNDLALDRTTVFDAYPDTPLLAVRRLQGAVGFNHLCEVERLLPLLPEHPLAPGIRLMALAALRDYSSILAASDFQPSGATRLEIESACYAHIAIGIACSESQRLRDADIHSAIALTLAQMLGITNRIQMLTIEQARVSGLRGEPVPETIEQQLLTAIPFHRRRWAQRTYSEQLISLGDYSGALLALGVQELDGFEDAAQREFLHALMGYPAARLETDPILQPDLSYTRLSQAIRRQENGFTRIQLAAIKGQPQQSYALLIEGSLLAGKTDTAQQAVRMLENMATPSPDQEVLRSFILWGAYLNGVELHRADTYPQQIVDALARLRRRDEMFTLLQRMKPDRLALLMFSPVSREIDAAGFSDLPLLCGKVLMIGGQSHTLPGRVGRHLVLEAMGIPDEMPTRSEKRRLTEALKALGATRVVNVGGLVSNCLRMYGAARRAQQPSLAIAWKGSYSNIFGLLTPDVRDHLLTYPDFDHLHVR